MNFEEFCNEVVESIAGYLSEYDIEHITTETIMKNNGLEYTGVVILLKDEEVAPSIYLDYFFMLYKQGRNLDDVLSMIRSEYKRARETIKHTDFSVNKDGLEDNVFLKVINYEKNIERLKDCPYIMFHDLAVCFRYLVNLDDDGVASAIISNRDLEKWELSTEELYKIAMDNTRKLFPPKIKKMEDVVPSIKDLIDEDTNNKRLYILTNESGVNGATSILYDDVIREFAREQESNICILPSSIHELVLICGNQEDKAYLGELVRQVNKYIVTEADYLSNNVFFYDLYEDKITI